MIPLSKAPSYEIPVFMAQDIERARSALFSLPPDFTREFWLRAAMAAKNSGLSEDDFIEWSRPARNFNERDCRNVWKSIKPNGGITAATLFHMAKEQGWRNADSVCQQYTPSSNKPKDTGKSKGPNVNQVWECCVPATIDYPYIQRKQGIPDGLRVYPEDAPPLVIEGQNVANWLVVPCWSNGVLKTLQFIPPGEGKKLNLSGASFGDGYFTVGEVTATDRIYIVEGLGVAWSAHKVTGAAAVVCFGSGRMMTVAKVLREKYPSARLVVLLDRGMEELAAKVAIEINGEWVAMPSLAPANYDANDYLLECGEDALRDLLAQAVFELPLSVVFADELPRDFTPPDEIVEGVLIAGDGSILYGDSNSAKTFLVIDMGCSVARGVNWLGRKTEPGLVVYLAAESPASVRRRLQAYQKHHDIRVMNFAVVQNPINLFDGEADTQTVIKTVQLLEKKCGQKARLIIGDTLARLSAGANENAGQDMGVVVRHFDRIRNECGAHFMLIHHCGKNAAAGARGWSGVRAAVDTEIEITDSPAGRCAEITKQRDLSTKGIRIGFRLETVTLGLTKWKSPATSCVVIPADAPPKSTNKRLSEVGGAIVEYLSANKGIKKRDLVKHFDGRYDSSAVYRELKKLVEAGTASDYMGFVSFLSQNETPSCGGAK